MRRDHRPNWLRRWAKVFEAWRTRHFLYPQFEHFGDGGHIARPQDIHVHGRGISAGNNVHMAATRTQNIWLTSWQWWDSHGKIEIGDGVLLTPGVRISSSKHVKIGDGTMLASNVYVTDSDWHGTYDRTTEAGKSAPVELKENVWIGDSAIICKGVTIGANSIVGAGSVVVDDIPANTIAAGVPAVVVKHLDPNEPRRTRMDYFADPVRLDAEMELLHRHMLKGNTLWGWLRVLIAPRKGD
jgi:acetyltransferase-like isoleucine patch superfamily enzyme